MKKETKTTRKKFEKLRIIGNNYKITYHKVIVDERNGHSLDSQINESTQEIKIKKGLNYEYELKVIIHEALHGIDFEICFNLSNEEDRNTQFTTGISCFIRDNQEFVTEYMRILNGG